MGGFWEPLGGFWELLGKYSVYENISKMKKFSFYPLDI